MDRADRYPPQVKFIIGNEACERFSFYGMSSILFVYMTDALLYSREQAQARYHLFVMATYLTPLLGGWIADRFLGRYRTILFISFAYLGGHAVLAAWETREGLVAGLALLALGAGGIKPCVSAFVGEQIPPERKVLLERIYGWFYVIINVGSASAKALIPTLLDVRGPAVAFGVPGVLFLVSILVFWAGRRRYVRVAPTGRNPHGFLRVVRRAVRRLGTGKPEDHWLDGARDQHPAEAVDGARAVFRILGVFAAVTIFWTLFDQKASSWVAQSKEMVLAIGDWRIGPAQVQVLNPLLILALVPIFNWLVFPALERRGVSLTPLRKMMAGMFLTVLSFAAAAVVQMVLDRGAAVNVAWQIPQYVLLTVGEILVSVTGLEFSFTQAPRSMRSAIMSFWYLTIALGNLLTALLTELVPLQGAAYFWFFTGLMLLAALVFRLVARRYRAPEPAPIAAA